MEFTFGINHDEGHEYRLHRRGPQYGRSLFVNAASVDARGLLKALTLRVARLGKYAIRCAVDLATHMRGEQFATGQTITTALDSSQEAGAGFSYCLLGQVLLQMWKGCRMSMDVWIGYIIGIQTCRQLKASNQACINAASSAG